MKYRVYGTVTGSAFMGEFEADSPEEALQKADEQYSPNFCHQCSASCEDAEHEAVTAEPVAPPG